LEEGLKIKLSYEWRNIYRHLSSTEGHPTRKQVVEALSLFKVTHLTNHELKYLLEHFGNGTSLDIERASKTLGLHTP